MNLPLIARAEQHRPRLAVVDADGNHTYRQLLEASARVASALLAGRADLKGERVAFLITPGFAWVAVQWGIWRAGGIAVPLPLAHALPELEYLLDDADPMAAVFDAANESVLKPLVAARGLRAVAAADALRTPLGSLPPVESGLRAMILYTSGTTSRPKGVVTTHDNLTAQITTLVQAWEWSAADRTVLCLPLHHVHGIVNVLSCALWAGAVCEILPRFDAPAVWERLTSGQITVFMAVPTIYYRLIAAWETALPERRAQLSEGVGRLRLMVSGSASLPVSTLERWRQITGHTLLERYGMTEIGMALSNPLHGRRISGSVGAPLPDVEVRLVDDDGAEIAPGTPGEIEVRAPGVFREYWCKPEATRMAFRDGWFRTGDVAVVENGAYRILGRQSVDIIKTGGHKVSALEIEEALRAHPAIAECAVVAVPDAEWGECPAAAVVLHASQALDLERLRAWARERLTAHKIPRHLLVVEKLPRNAMGKVTKSAVAALFGGGR